MSVRIRMKMTGRKHRPFFRICVIDRQKARDGLPIEELGTYDPMVKDTDERTTLQPDRIKYWMGVGAKPSERVTVLFKKYLAKWEAKQAEAAATAQAPTA